MYDTEIFDRNTIPCKPSYFSVHGRLQPCLFDLGEGNPTDAEKEEIEEQIYELKLQKEDYVEAIETLQEEKGMKYFGSYAPEC